MLGRIILLVFAIVLSVAAAPVAIPASSGVSFGARLEQAINVVRDIDLSDLAKRGRKNSNGSNTFGKRGRKNSNGSNTFGKRGRKNSNGSNTFGKRGRKNSNGTNTFGK